MSKPLKILYVTGAFVAPPHTGCFIRTINIARQLKKSGQVTILAVSRFLDELSIQQAEKEFDKVCCMTLGDYNESRITGRFLKKWHMHWPTSRGLQAARTDQECYRRLLEENDLVWFHTLGAEAPFSVSKQMPPCVMDLDDLNHCKYDLRSRYDNTLRLRLSAKVQSFKWKRHEYAALEKYDILTVCSDQDKDYLASDNVYVVPNGFETPLHKPVWHDPDPNRLGFIGALGYGPNYEGLAWFRDSIWPMIRQQNPKMQLRLVGSPPPSRYQVKAEGFEHLGYVEDTAAEMATWSTMIVPITYGGGTRIKIIEAFSKMCPVVSTSVGAHGNAGKHGKHYLLADEPKQFADSCLQLSSHPDAGRRLAEEAWRLFNEKYTWEVIGKSVRNIVETLNGKK